MASSIRPFQARFQLKTLTSVALFIIALTGCAPQSAARVEVSQLTKAQREEVIVAFIDEFISSLPSEQRMKVKESPKSAAQKMDEGSKSQIITQLVDVCNELSETDDIKVFAEANMLNREVAGELTGFDDRGSVHEIVAVREVCPHNQEKLDEFLAIVSR